MPTIAVLIPDESYKMQLIGRDASTIRAFREITGVDLVIDDDPTQVFLKAEDAEKLQTARGVLQAMIRDKKFTKDDIRQFAKSPSAENPENADELVDAVLKSEVPIKYYNTSIFKMIVFSICTFSIYDVYWMYKNWRIIKEHTKTKISPFWRAFFAVICCYRLFTIIKCSIEQKNFKIPYSAGGLAALFIVCALCGNFSARTDHWVGNILFINSFCSIVPLIILQKAINVHNHNVDPSIEINTRFRKRSIFVAVVGGILMLLVLYGMFFVPEKQDNVIFTDELIKSTQSDGAEDMIFWKDLDQVSIITTDEGPWREDVFFLLMGKDGTSFCSIPQSAIGFDDLLERLQQLPGFDNETLIKAMGSTSNAKFICWKRNPEIGKE